MRATPVQEAWTQGYEVGYDQAVKDMTAVLRSELAQTLSDTRDAMLAKTRRHRTPNPLVAYREAHPENVVWDPEKGWHDRAESEPCPECREGLGFDEIRHTCGRLPEPEPETTAR